MPTIKGTMKKEIKDVLSDETKTFEVRVMAALLLLAESADALEARQ